MSSLLRSIWNTPPSPSLAFILGIAHSVSTAFDDVFGATFTAVLMFDNCSRSFCCKVKHYHQEVESGGFSFWKRELRYRFVNPFEGIIGCMCLAFVFRAILFEARATLLLL
ncbi:MAG: hypothetical protein J0L94_04495 [Rhodothermia bacterium]|nr:hypothetical protein [Rhodothermia bacterium]